MKALPALGLMAATAVAALGLTSCASTTGSSAPTPSPSGSATVKMDEHSVPVGDANGHRETVTAFSGASIPNGQTASIPQLPPVGSDLLLNCGTLQGWDTLVPCIEKSKQGGQWYINTVNEMHAAGQIQFSWDDVKKWAGAKTAKGNLPEERVVEVYGYTEAEMPADTARANVADLVGGKDVASKLVVVYQTSPFLNTIRPLLKDQEATPTIKKVADYNKEVRVSLAPLVLDNAGAAIGIVKDATSGVHVDCYNIWGHWMFMPVTPTSPLVCPAGTAMAGLPVPSNGVCTPPVTIPQCTSNCGGSGGCTSNCSPPQGCTSDCTPHQGCTTNCGGTPGCTANCGGTPGCTSNCSPPPTCPAGYVGTPPNCLIIKDPTQDPAPRGNAGNGGGVNADPGPGTYVPPAQMQQPPAQAYTAPAAPKPTAAPVKDSTGNTIPAPNPNPAPFTPAPVETQVNPAPVPGATTPPRNSGDPGTPNW